MGKISKKLKKSIVMLLVCALVAGSIPMNTYAAPSDSYTVTVDAKNATVKAVSENDVVEYIGETEDGKDIYSVVSGNDFTFSVEEDTDYEVISVGYTVDGTSTQIFDEEGVYTVPLTTIRDDVEITVATQPVNTTPKETEYVVTVVEDENVKVTGIMDGNKVVSGNSLTFTVTADEGYEAVVTYDMGEVVGALLTANEDGIYTTPQVTADITIKVTATELEQDVAYELRKIDLSEVSEYVDVVFVDGYKKIEDEYYVSTSANDLTFKVTLKEDAPAYLVIEDVVYGFIEDESYIQASFIDGVYIISKEVIDSYIGELKIAVLIQEVTEKVHFTIKNATVSDNNGVIYRNGDSQYVLKGEEFSFIVNEAEDCTIEKVTANGKELTKDKDGKYTITVDDYTYIRVVATKNSDKDVKISYKQGEVELKSIVVNGNYYYDYKLLDSSEGIDTILAKLSEGAIANITFAANSNYKILDGNKEVDKKTYTVTVGEEGAELTVASKAIQVIELIKDGGEPIPSIKGVYTIDNYVQSTYTMRVFLGDDYATVKSVEILDGSKAAKSSVISGSDIYTFKFAPEEVKEGKNLTLKVTDKDGVETKATLKVLPVAKEIVVNGGKTKVNQPAYTAKAYTLKLNPANAINALEIVNKGRDIDKAWIEDGKLHVCTLGDDFKEGYVTLKYMDQEIKFDVAVTNPLTGVKPSVKFKDATNASLTLTLSSTLKDLTFSGKNVARYVITVTPDKTYLKTVSESIVNFDIKPLEPIYVPWEGNTQDVKITLNDYEGMLPVGIKYNVSVRLELSKYTTDAVKLTASTYAWAYETNLKLKNGTTKMYTGESNVAVAMPVFSKTTTFKNIASVEIDRYEDCFDVWCEDGKILVTAYPYAPAGKYVITAKAYVGDSNMVASSAKVTITVLPGIYGIYAKAQPTVYKEANKAASFKVDYSAWDNADNYLKNAKLKFSVQSDFIDDIEKYVTVDQKGKVTISKDYVFTEKDFFYIKVDAADYEGNMTSVSTDYIRIINEKTQLKGIEIIKDGEKVDVSKTVSINDIMHADILLVDADGNYVDANEFILKSSKKDLLIYEPDEEISNYCIGGINKAVNGVKLIAELRDGSKAKAEVTIAGIKGLEDSGLSLQFTSDYDSYYTPVKTGEKDGKELYEVHYQRPLRSALYLDVVDSNNEYVLGKAAKFDVKISQATTLYTYKTAGYYIIEPKSEKPIVVEFINKFTGKKKEYTLINDSIRDNLTKLSKVKVDGAFYEGIGVWSSVTVNLSNVEPGQIVKISQDNQKWIKDKDGSYVAFVRSLQDNFYQIDNEGNITVSAYGYGGEWGYLKKGSYKMYVSVGYLDENDNFIQTSKDTAVTFKVVEPKASIKLATSYTINLKDGNSVPFKSTTKVPVSYVNDLQNANMKGKPNTFASELFDIQYIEGVPSLVYVGDINNIPTDKNQLTGWVTYFDGLEEKTVQIKVNLKKASAAKYTIENATVVSGNDARVAVTKKNATDFGVYLAYTETLKDKENGVMYKVACDGSEYITVSANHLNKGKNVIEVYVVGNDIGENFVDAYEEAYAKADTEGAIELIKTYGQKLKTTITVIDSSEAVDANKVVNLNKTVKLTSDDFEASAYTEYVPVNNNYTGIVVDDIINVSESANGLKDDLSVKYDKESESIIVSVSKNTLDVNKGTDKAVQYKKNVTVKLNVTFVDVLTKEIIKGATQKVTLNVTLPTEPQTLTQIDSAKTKPITTAVKAVVYDAEDYLANVKTAVEKVLPKDVVVADVNMNELVTPDYGKEGSATVYVIVSEIDKIEVDVKFAALFRQELDFDDVLSDIIDVTHSDLLNTIWDKNTTAAAISAKIKEKIDLTNSSNLRFIVLDGERVNSTEDSQGSLTCEFVLSDVFTGYNWSYSYTFMLETIQQ